MKYIKLFENWETNTIKYHSKDDLKIEHISSKLNSFEYRMTDDSSTYDFMMVNYNYIKDQLMSLNSLELFEVIIRLNDNGLKHLQSEFFYKWVNLKQESLGLHYHDIKNLENAIKTREQTNKISN